MKVPNVLILVNVIIATFRRREVTLTPFSRKKTKGVSMANNHLTKEEELTLGALVQKSLRAKAIRDSSTYEKESSYELDGEVLTSHGLESIISDGDRAKNKLVDSNVGLVWSRAKRFKEKFPTAPELEDLAQEGFTGLVKAIEKYSPERDNKLSTMAYYWIDQAIGRATNITGRLVRLPENRIMNLTEINRIRARYEESDLTTEQVNEIIMKEMNLSKEKFMNIINAGSTAISLNRTVKMGNGDEGGAELIDFIGELNAEVPVDSIIAKDMMVKVLQEKVAGLSDLEQDTIAASYFSGEGIERRKSIAHVRDKYQISQQKFKRVLNAALAKMREQLEGQDLLFEDFMN